MSLVGRHLDPLEPRTLLSSCGCGSLPPTSPVEPDVTQVAAQPRLRNAKQPRVRIGFASVVEGDNGQSAAMVFNVRRSGPKDQLGTARVRFTTAPSSVPDTPAAAAAVQGVDFLAAAGVLRFKPGQRLARINITVNGNNAAESNRLVAVELSQPKNVRIQRGLGLGVILDDDSPGADLQLLGQSLVSNVDNLITMQLTVRNNGGSTSQNGRVLFVATATGFPGLSFPEDPEAEPGPVFRLLEQYNLAGIAPGATDVRTFIFDTNAAIHCTDAAGRTNFGGYIELRASNDINPANNTAAMLDTALVPDDDTNFSQGCSSGWVTLAP